MSDKFRVKIMGYTEYGGHVWSWTWLKCYFKVMEDLVSKTIHIKVLRGILPIALHQTIKSHFKVAEFSFHPGFYAFKNTRLHVFI